MANEITSGISLSASKNGASVGFAVNKNTTMAGAVMFQTVQTIGTTTEAITFPSDFSGIPSWLLIYNMESAGGNFVQIGLDNANPMTQIFAKLRAGEFMLLPANTATLYADADTAAVNIMIVGTML